MPTRRYELDKGIEVLFNRTTVVPTTLPSGRVVENEDDAPNLIRVIADDQTYIFERTASGGLRGRFKEAEQKDLLAEFDAAEVSKRAPK